jgi:phosphate:Na+ symporter
MLVIMSLASAGIITPLASLAMVLGANLGSAVNPLVEGTAGDAVRLRLPVGNLINRLIGCAIALPLLHPITSALAWVDPAPARMAANFHTAFNFVLAAAFLPALPYIAKALTRLFPEQLKAADPGKPQYLDAAALETPSVALANAAREVLRMADVVETMLRGSQDVLHTGDRKRVEEISRMDDILDKLHEAVERYLIQISHDGLSDEESHRLSDILAFSINLEHIGDIVEKNLMELAAKRIKKRLSFSSEGLAELDQMHERLLDHLQLAVAVFMVGDVQAARRLVQEKEHFRDLERTATERHFARVREGRPESIETSGLHVDIIRDLKRIDSHIAATAYPLLEQSDMLRRSRLV